MTVGRQVIEDIPSSRNNSITKVYNMKNSGLFTEGVSRQFVYRLGKVQSSYVINVDLEKEYICPKGLIWLTGSKFIIRI